MTAMFLIGALILEIANLNQVALIQLHATSTLQQFSTTVAAYTPGLH